jgi:hypothetical protein
VTAIPIGMSLGARRAGSYVDDGAQSGQLSGFFEEGADVDRHPWVRQARIDSLRSHNPITPRSLRVVRSTPVLLVKLARRLASVRIGARSSSRPATRSRRR